MTALPPFRATGTTSMKTNDDDACRARSPDREGASIDPRAVASAAWGRACDRARQVLGALAARSPRPPEVGLIAGTPTRVEPTRSLLDGCVYVDSKHTDLRARFGNGRIA